MYIQIGILGRSADNIYIYINLVITYYAKEDGSADSTSAPSQAPWPVLTLRKALQRSDGKFEPMKI